MKMPLIAPRSAPIPMEIRKISGHGISGQTASVNTVVMYMADTAMAVKLTSIPPETRTSIAATARMPSTMEARRRSLSVVTERKFGSEIVATTQKATMTSATSVSFRVKKSLERKPVMMRACGPVRPR